MGLTRLTSRGCPSLRRLYEDNSGDRSLYSQRGLLDSSPFFLRTSSSVVGMTYASLSPADVRLTLELSIGDPQALSDVPLAGVPHLPLPVPHHWLNLRSLGSPMSLFAIDHVIMASCPKLTLLWPYVVSRRARRSSPPGPAKFVHFSNPSHFPHQSPSVTPPEEKLGTPTALSHQPIHSWLLHPQPHSITLYAESKSMIPIYSQPVVTKATLRIVPSCAYDHTPIRNRLDIRLGGSGERLALLYRSPSIAEATGTDPGNFSERKRDGNTVIRFHHSGVLDLPGELQREHSSRV